MVSLYLRITEKGKRRYEVANTRKQADYGVYCLRYEVKGRQVWETVGESLHVALVSLKNREVSFIKDEFRSPGTQTFGTAKAYPTQQKEKFLELKRLTTPATAQDQNEARPCTEESETEE